MKKRISEKKGSSKLTNLAIGIVAVVLFVSLFIIVLNRTDVLSAQNISSENLSNLKNELPAIDPVDAKLQSESDKASFQRAIFYKNGYYCNLIYNVSLKNECLTNLPENSTNEKPKFNTPTEADIEDSANYNRAILYKNTDFCKQISDSNLKERCFTNAKK